MRLQVLVAAVDADVRKLADQMNLDSDAFIVNQKDQYAYEEFEHRGHRIRCMTMAERGVGLSRNTALQRAEGEICLFSDEDICLENGYEEKILKSFREISDADVIIFNLKVDSSRATYHTTSRHRVHWYNYGRYGIAAVAVRREALLRGNISFSLLFGGGAKYSNGEDSLFLHDCMKKGLHIYADTPNIGEEIPRQSTWFQGYHDKFFFDRGVLYAYLYGRMATVWALRFLITKKEQILNEFSFGKAFRLMKDGIREGRQIRRHDETTDRQAG